MTKKIGKSVVALYMSVATIKRLNRQPPAELFRQLFDGVSPKLAPTHLFFHESRGGRRAFSPTELDGLDWVALSGSPRSGSIELLYRGTLKGRMDLGVGYARQPRLGVQTRRGTHDFPARGDWITVQLDMAPLLKRELFDEAQRLFENMVNATNACHGRSCVGSRSTATYTLLDFPEYDWADPVEWNGIVVEPGMLFQTEGVGGGPAVNCLPRFDPWINVLGREYVELLGREKLLSLDVYSKREDDAGRIWLQMTERPEQAHLPEVKKHVQRLMDSLDAQDVFCRSPRTMEEREHGIVDYRRPDFDWTNVLG